MAKQVYNINGVKIKAESKDRARYLYNQDFGSMRSSTPSNNRTVNRNSNRSSGQLSQKDYFLRKGESPSEYTKRIANARRTFTESLANADNPSATNPERTVKKTTPDYRQQYIDFVTNTFPQEDVQAARQSLNTLNQRIADTTLTGRRDEDRIRLNESGALARGLNDQLSDSSQNVNRQLADLSIAASPLTSTLQGAESAYRTLASLPTEQEQNPDAFTLSAGQQRYAWNPDKGEYEVIGQADPKVDFGKPMESLRTGGLVSGQLSYSTQDYNDDAIALEQSRGADGWVNPAVYQQLYQSWITSGGLADDFAQVFPPEQYANPANTWLPGALRNTRGQSTRTVNVDGRVKLIDSQGNVIRDLGETSSGGNSLFDSF